jgi:hypothetical protein
VTKVFGPKGLDRRRAPRIPVPPGGPLSVVGARLVNASPYGMMIHSPVPMDRNAILPLRLVLADDKIDVQTRVAACWRTWIGQKKVYGIGLEFTVLPDPVRERLRDTLATLGDPTPRPA